MLAAERRELEWCSGVQLESGPKHRNTGAAALRTVHILGRVNVDLVFGSNTPTPNFSTGVDRNARGCAARPNVLNPACVDN